MKETFYLKHDYNARNDEKILKLRTKYGAEGLGIYWMLVEKLAESSEGRLLLADIPSIAYELHSECERITDVIRTYGLFELNEEYFWSKRLMQDLAERNEICKKAKLSAKVRWATHTRQKAHEKAHENANAMQGKEKRGKERKREESDSELKSPTPAQTMRDFLQMISEKGERFVKFTKQTSLSVHLTEDIVRAELDKFSEYWTELTKDGRRQRWELEKVFEVSKRLGTWFSKINNFQKKSSSPKILVV